MPLPRRASSTAVRRSRSVDRRAALAAAAERERRRDAPREERLSADARRAGLSAATARARPRLRAQTQDSRAAATTSCPRGRGGTGRNRRASSQRPACQTAARAEGRPYGRARGSAPGAVRGGRRREAGGRAGRQEAGARRLPGPARGSRRLDGHAGRGAVGKRSSRSASKRRAAPCGPAAPGAGRRTRSGSPQTGTRWKAQPWTPSSSRSCSRLRAPLSAPVMRAAPRTRSPTRSPSGAGLRCSVFLSPRGPRRRPGGWTRFGSMRWRSASRRLSRSASTPSSCPPYAQRSRRARSASVCGDS